MILIVIPCLNEERNIERLVRQFSQSDHARIVIADGGSTDHTAAIAQKLALEHPNVLYLHNPKRLQSAAVNLAVATFGEQDEVLIRIDAHAEYPDRYCQTLVEEAQATQAASVVVAMDTQGVSCFQQAVAAASNSKLGNGGSAHRKVSGAGRWVDHGHHALMRIDAFKSVGGYDETFSHNEDAELDMRLRKAGFSIWLTGKTSLTYHPRPSPLGLFKQYVNYGRGRARTLLKHRAKPKLRQMLPVAVAPVALLALAAPLYWIMAVPFSVWVLLCLGYGAWLGKKAGHICIAMSGVAAMIMHFAWSIGFWQAIFPYLSRLRERRFSLANPPSCRMAGWWKSLGKSVRAAEVPSPGFLRLAEEASLRNPASPASGRGEHAITLCICTFRRPHIADTLRSVAQLRVPPDWALQVVVADNDDTPSAKALVETTARDTGLSLTYLHAPARNISIARNACLDAITTPLAAFIDDDELMTPGWLVAMIETVESTHADAVLGPVRAVYNSACPEWIRIGDFHATMPVWVGGKIITGYSCNVVFRTDAPALRDLRFRTELGRSGGEDTAFFAAVHKAGGTIVFAPEAVVTEAVTPERATLGWLLKRRFRSGQTHGLLLLEKDGSDFAPRMKNMVKALAKSLFCFSAALLHIMSPVHRAFWLLRGTVHAGAVSRLLGKQEITQYG